jgi:GTP cyclohydrolase I
MNEEIQDLPITPEMQEQMDEINSILNNPQIEPTMALNIIINAVQVCYDMKELFNDLDRALISKALTCFQEKVANKENFTINVE